MVHMVCSWDEGLSGVADDIWKEGQGRRAWCCAKDGRILAGYSIVPWTLSLCFWLVKAIERFKIRSYKCAKGEGGT